MALAWLRYEEIDGEDCRFSIDIGSNRFYAYAIGGEETIAKRGIRLIQDPVHVSKLTGPMDEDALGRGHLLIPAASFSADHRFVQLHSFRDRERRGPAVSPIVEADAAHSNQSGIFSLTREYSDVPSAAAKSLQMRSRARRVTLAQSRPLSTAQFIDSLVALLPSLLPIAGGALTSVASAGGPLMLQLMPLLQQLLAQATRPPTALGPLAVPPAMPSAPAHPLSRSTQAKPPAPHRHKHPVPGVGQTLSPVHHSQAMALPLLAMLPALMPLLQQVLTPQTIQSVLSTADPSKLIGTISNAVQGIAQLGLQATEAERAHLRQLNPGVDDPAFMNLLGQMSLNLSRQAKASTFKRVTNVRLHFADASTVSVGGRDVVAYVYGSDLEFPLALESPKSLGPSRLRMTIQDAENLDEIARNQVRTPPLSEGRLPVVNRFAAEKIASLQPGRAYLVKAELIWKNKEGQPIGVTMTQTIHVISQFIFDSVQEGEGPIALNDVDRFRDYWHKVWAADFSKDIVRREYDCKYYYSLQTNLTANEQTETRLSERKEGIRKAVGRLSSGLLLSPNRLNELLPQISSHPSLTEPEMRALLSPMFAERLSLAARNKAKFSGRPGNSAALWVFPEVKIQRLTMRRTETVDPAGHVTSLGSHEVFFPLPVLAHFVGVSSE